MIKVLSFSSSLDTRREGAREFKNWLLSLHQKGVLNVPMQAVSIFWEMAKNTADHTCCKESFFQFQDDGSSVVFAYWEFGSGLKKPLEWCIQNGNTTGNAGLNRGLGMSTIFLDLSIPIGMRIEFEQFFSKHTGRTGIRYFGQCPYAKNAK